MSRARQGVPIALAGHPSPTKTPWRAGFSPREASASLGWAALKAPRGLKLALQSVFNRAVFDKVWLSRRRQPHLQACSSLVAIARADGPPMLGDDAFCDGQAEACSARVETRGHEGAEDVRQQVSRDAGTVVLHPHGDACFARTLGAAPAHDDLAMRRFDGV